MSTYEIAAPDGQKYRIEGPPGATDDQVRAAVLAQHPDAGKPKSAAEAPHHTTLGEAADVGASLVSGAGASLVGGLAKAGAAAEQAVGLNKGFDMAHGTDKLEDALTWKPKTDVGKRVMADIGSGLQAFEKWSDRQGEASMRAILAAGNKASEVAKSMGAPQSVVDFIDTHKEQVAAAYGAATKTAINAVPLVLGGETVKGRAPLRAAEEAPKPAFVPPEAPSAPQPAPDLSLAPSAPRAAPEAPVAAPAQVSPPLAAQDVPRGTPNTALEGPPAGPPATPVSPTARAQVYVRDRLGLSWDALADATKKKLEGIAASAGALDRLNPDAVKRQARLEGLRVPITTTAGKLNRDNVQLLREQGAAATASGRSIVDTDIKANRDLRANVETLIDRLRGQGKTRATATDREGVGAAVVGRSAEPPGALTLKQRQAKATTKSLYDKARATDPDATVAPDALYEFVRGSPEVLNPQIQHLAWLNNWLKKAGIEKFDEEGAATGERRPIKLTELDDLRKKAGKMAGGTGDSAHYAKEVLTAIDATFEQLPDSAKAWKAAREAHKAERGEFANQGAIERLVGTKGGNFGTDPKTALEDVWKVSFKNAKLEEVRQLKRSLLSGSPEARLAGKKALRELRSETGRDLLREITKNVSTNAKGEVNITAEGINNWIKSVGGGTLDGGIEKLQVMVGRGATRELMDIREAAQITKTEPTVRNVGSNTFQKILNWMDDTGLGGVVKKIPGAGPAVTLAESAVKATEHPRTARAAAESATSAAERAAASARDARAKRIQAEQQVSTPRTYGAPPP